MCKSVQQRARVLTTCLSTSFEPTINFLTEKIILRALDREPVPEILNHPPVGQGGRHGRCRAEAQVQRPVVGRRADLELGLRLQPLGGLAVGYEQDVRVSRCQVQGGGVEIAVIG
jgi:hypothetical protein